MDFDFGAFSSNFITSIETGSNPDNQAPYNIEVFVNQTIDREALVNDLISFTVSGTDRAFFSLSNTSTFYMKILDVNDNPPFFTGLPYSFSVAENTAIGEENC